MLTRHLALTLGVLVLVVAASCGSPLADVGHPVAFAKGGLQFQMPGNWKVTDDETEDGVRLLFIEEPGDALLIVQLLPSEIAEDLPVYAKNFEQAAKENVAIGTLSESVFLKRRPYGEYESLKETFSISLLGETLPHTRMYYRRTFGDTVCFLIAQVADEDRAKVFRGFKQVLGSLRYSP